MNKADYSSRQIRQLAKAVSTAFATSNLPDEVLTNPRIELVNLPWQVPPLQTSLNLQGLGLQEMLNVEAETNASKLHNFWVSNLNDLHSKPGTIFKDLSYKTLNRLWPSQSKGKKMYAFSMPAGWPDQLDCYTGVTFSLEVAHLAMVNLPLTNIVQDASNFVVTTADGFDFGVRNGLPLADSPWEVGAEYMVQDMLEMSRGRVLTNCLYDPIALARSVLHVHRDKFGDDFQAIDYCIQALRYLTHGRTCPELMKTLQEAPEDRRLWLARKDAIEQAMEVMASPDLNDREKLRTLESLLVPTVISVATFRRQIFYTNKYPQYMEEGKSQEINSWLANYYETEIPENYK